MVDGQGPTKLRTDCGRCFGLCCVVPAFSASVDFAIDKAADQPCRHLRTDSRCGIHTELRPRGFRGCTVYDCFGAGQQVSQVTFGGRDWREDTQTAGAMFAVFPVMRQLHELLWYLTAALTLCPTGPLAAELHQALDVTDELTGQSPEALTRLDLGVRRRDIAELLRRTSALVRARGSGPGPDHRGADLLGADLRGTDLRGADLRGACLIGADLRGGDLSVADLLGADLRDTDLRGCDLTGSLFVIQSQLDAAIGDATTRVPAGLAHPAHWAGSAPTPPGPR